MDYIKIFKTFFFIVVFVLLGVFGTLTYQRFIGPKQTVTVTGSGEIDAPVNQATITVVVENTASSNALALVANQKDVATLKNALMNLGIPESRITQSSFQPPIFRYMPENGAVEGSDPKEMMRPDVILDDALTITTNLTIILDSLKRIDDVYKTINNNPNTQITNTNYSLANQKDWETKAKEIALKDARNQAESIAKINRLKVGKLVSITDYGSPQQLMDQSVMFKGTEPSIGSEIQINQVNYSEQTVKIYASYTAVYELY